MGFFDRFGVGGGKLTIQLGSARVPTGGTLNGKIVFNAGKRAQKITAIKATVHCNTTAEHVGANGNIESRSESKVIVPQTNVTGALTTEAERNYEFPFTFNLPAGLTSSTHGKVEYRVSASADIDGEIDPGATAEFQVDGVPAGAPAGGKAGVGVMQGAPVMGAPVAHAPIGVGSAVLAQWQDGSWQPGRVVAANNGMFGVDWDNPALGASTWVGAHQVQAAAPVAHAPIAGMPLAGMPVAPVAALVVGAHVMAQWQDGNWYGARIVATNNGMFGVDWDNPGLGASTWVASHQITPG